MFDTILFDLDGTLSDSSLGITNAIVYALKKYGIEEKHENCLRFIGPPLGPELQKVYGLKDPKEAVDFFREYYGDKGWKENELYPHIKEVLKDLKNQGKTLLVATSKPEFYAKKILEHFGILPYFDGVFGASLDESKVSKDEIIEEALSSVNYKKAIMVGDREHDVIGAHKNHIPCVGVLYGFGNKKELEAAKADYIINKIVDLENIINQ